MKNTYCPFVPLVRPSEEFKTPYFLKITLWFSDIYYTTDLTDALFKKIYLLENLFGTPIQYFEMCYIS